MCGGCSEYSQSTCIKNFLNTAKCVKAALSILRVLVQESPVEHTMCPCKVTGVEPTNLVECTNGQPKSHMARACLVYSTLNSKQDLKSKTASTTGACTPCGTAISYITWAHYQILGSVQSHSLH